MSLDSSLETAPQEKSSCPSMGSVLDNYLVKGCGRFGNSCSLCSSNGNVEGNPWFEMIKVVLGGDLDGHEDVGDDDDILDLLPRDPFGMNFESTFTSISDWIEDFEWGEDAMSGIDGTREKIGDHLHFLGLSWGWNGIKNFNWENSCAMDNGISVSGDADNGCQYFDVGVVADENTGEFLIVSHKNICISSNEAEKEKPQNCVEIETDAQRGVPHDALFFVLGYLGVRDLLSVEHVCKSLCDAVRGDPLLWRTVHIDKPLNERTTDDTLVKLTSRAQGTLQSLVLVNCFMITDNGLGCVLQSNPRLMKLIVPDCIRLTIEGILFNLRVLKSSGTPGIKLLRIGGVADVCNVTEQQFEEMMELLDASKYLQQRDQKLHFYQGGYSHIIHEDDHAIDIQMCPRCQKLRPIYDCPSESCQEKNQAAQLCRGCTICIARCIHCGRCIKDFDYVETFCLDLLCLNCWNQFLHCPENSVEKEAPTCTIISQRTMYQFCLWLMEYPLSDVHTCADFSFLTL